MVMPKNFTDSGLQRTWLADAPCWGLCSHFCGDGLFCREGKDAFPLAKKGLLIFQNIVFGLDFIHDKSGPPCWLLDISGLNLVGAHDSHYCRVRRSKDMSLSSRISSFQFMEFFIFRYGDIAPASFAGKVMGGLCALCGTFILTLPLPIVVNR